VMGLDCGSDEADDRPMLCRYCFKDQGLQRMASDFENETGTCPNCGAQAVPLLNANQLWWLSEMFFVRGSTLRTEYGAAPLIAFNEYHNGSLNPDARLAQDVELLQKCLGVGFFHYGPRLWMLGHITPLKQLQSLPDRPFVIDRILSEYPTVQLNPGQTFYRVRKAPSDPTDPSEYDAPPAELAGSGRLDVPQRPILYGSQDLEVCVHECRFAAGDDLYAATLTPRQPLRLLDLSAILEEDCTEFESLDLAVLMVFLAASHSYEISRAIASAAADRGFDGLIYTSYFSLLRTGTNPFETTLGLSHRRFAPSEHERSKVIANLALFGHPISAGGVEILGINRLLINRVAYGMTFGPVHY